MSMDSPLPSPLPSAAPPTPSIPKMTPRTEPSNASLRSSSHTNSTQQSSASPTTPSDPSKASTSATETTPRRRFSKPEVRPPEHIINLDLPPRERYKEIGKIYKDKLQALTPLFDEVLDPVPHKKLVSFIARHILRRVCSREEQEEIRGLVEVTDLPMYLIVAFNTLLDTFMGCTSGAVRLAHDPEKPYSDENRDKMLHFRTLDWGMDSLRELVILVHYQRGGKTIAQAITYAGFVGVLTGVRQGLSLSLNFRPAASENTRRRTINFHKILVLLGIRPSVSSQLRNFLFTKPKEELPTLAQIIHEFPRTPCTPCYVTLCDGDFAAFLEKDITHANVSLSEEFVSGTNHDVRMEAWKAAEYDAFTKSHPIPEAGGIAVDLLDDSQQRKRCVGRLYAAAASTRASRKAKKKRVEPGIGIKTVVSWCQAWPITNECTHFSCVMDPKPGEFAWMRYHAQPPDER
ncbi:hypothetical protein Dda_7441 [Drechslerella dactyloides]|uniref:ceramidase n=1 Tax=Drechslerella dactyloides TaxID=74499 RepID=A0AAD6IS89_DREDA|nr:hypothetical protein Dda_7441 [Drechslerella dactyloides]